VLDLTGARTSGSEVVLVVTVLADSLTPTTLRIPISLEPQWNLTKSAAEFSISSEQNRPG